MILNNTDKSDSEIDELFGHIEGKGFKIVQSRKPKAKLSLKAAACGCGGALNRMTGKKLHKLTAQHAYIAACAGTGLARSSQG